MTKASPYLEQQRRQMVEEHAPLVQRIAHHLKARLPANVQIDDLIQAGMIGLLEALRNFDGSKGASFSTFAGIRIRGAMLDEVRRGDWSPRSAHQQSRKVAEAINLVEQVTGRDAKDSEVAEKLGISIPDYHRMLSDANVGKVIGIEDLGVSEDVLSAETDYVSKDPYSTISHGHFRQALAKAIKSLPERESLVLSLYYDEEMNLKEIGAILDVSESRVSQIHSQAMHRLKARLSSWQS